MSKLTYHTKHHVRKQEEQVFPCILQHKDTDALWLFASSREATCITGVDLSLHKPNASMVCYKPFKGEVILTQE